MKWCHSIRQLIGRTPIVELTRIGSKLGRPLLAKCEFLNPLGSVKDRMADAIISGAEARGELSPGSTIVEATSGNSGIALAALGAIRGYKVVVVMPGNMSLEKRRALFGLGARVIRTPDVGPEHPKYYRTVAQRLASVNGWFLADQFRNPDNPAVHEAQTGPEIWEQTSGTLAAFVAGAGTGGTLTGVGRFLHRMNPAVRIVLADPVGSRLAHLRSPEVPFHDYPYAVEGLGGWAVPHNLDLSEVDLVESVSDQESYQANQRLIREEGVLAGLSSGTAIAAAIRIVGRLEHSGPVVILLADSWSRYFSKPWFREQRE